MPYAPGVEDRSGQFILQGAQAFAQGIEKLGDELSRQSKERKNYLGIADSLKAQGLMTDIEREHLNNRSTDEVVGAVKGALLVNELKTANEQRNYTAQQAAALKYNLEKTKQQDKALAKFNMMLAGQTAAPPPIPGEMGPPGPAAGPAITPQDYYTLAARAGVDMSKLIPEAAAAAKRYGRPGDIVNFPGHTGVVGVWNTDTSMQVMNTGQERTGTPGYTPAPNMEGGGWFTDEKGLSHWVPPKEIGLGYGNMGRSEYDMARITDAELDRQIVATQTEMAKNGPATLVPKLNAKGQLIKGFWPWSAPEQWTLQERFNDLLRQKAENAATLESLQKRPGATRTPTATPTSPSTNAPPAAPMGTNVTDFSDFERWQKEQQQKKK